MSYFRDGRDHYRLATTISDTKTVTTVSASFDPRFFDSVYCLSLSGARVITEGRGRAVMFPAARRWLFLKDYQRGGMIRHINHNAYLWTGLERTRAWREFTLLIEMSRLGLSVPEAYACRVHQRTLMYRASLIVEVVENEGSLMQIIKTQGFEAVDWQSLGKFMASFAVHRIYHADLNASNVLVQPNQRFVLIDFDKGCQFNGLRAPLFRLIFEKRMLRRLQRSLTKLKPASSVNDREFSESMWQSFMAGYQPRPTP